MTTPLCRTCHRVRVRRKHNTYCSLGCIPLSIRQANMRKARKTFAYRRRRIVFSGFLERLTQTLTREDLLATFQEIDRRAYQRGFQVGRYTQRELVA